MSQKITTSLKFYSHLLLDRTCSLGGFIACCKPHTFSSLHPEVSVITCRYNINFFREELYERLLFDEPKNITNSVTKRRAEYLAGRLSAMMALEGVGVSNAIVSTGKHRSPIWPKGYVGSITHNSDIAISIVAPSSHVAYLGIDRERLIPSDVAKGIATQILSVAEIKYYQNENLDFSLFFTLVFSAKESLFKAVYPYVERYLDFNAAEIIEICPQTGQFKIRITQTLLGGELEQGKIFKGHFDMSKGSVTTVILGSRDGPGTSALL